MTTVGVDVFKPARVDALWYNSYNYQYPSFKQKQLCDCFDCYRSKPLPAFRRSSVERMRQECLCYKDRIAGVPERIRREATILPWPASSGQESGNEAVVAPLAVPARPPTDFLVRPRISPKEYRRWRFETTPVMSSQTREEWNQFLSRCPERFDIQLPLAVPGDGIQPYYDGGYCLRFLRPHITKGLGMQSCSERIIGESQGPATDSPYRNITVITPAASYG
ncbi:unnamed protein product [Candidula unifasciata]|uniref:Uncharacterized protein n=1 Tax=Candidula unifasciata TaxID=100452 RepID=A0A8S3ZJZ9_9EUPU|nr:unnamed protein product [Candidula unifasciata]